MSVSLPWYLFNGSHTAAACFPRDRRSCRHGLLLTYKYGRFVCLAWRQRDQRIADMPSIELITDHLQLYLIRASDAYPTRTGFQLSAARPGGR